MQGLKTNMSWLLPWVLVLCFVLLSCSDLSDANHAAAFLCNIPLLPFYSSVIYSIPPKNNLQAFQIWFTLSFKWVSESHSVMSDSLQPHRPYSPPNSPDQNTGVGSLFLLQGIFPTQESNSGLLHCRRILYQLSQKGSPRILEWVAYPFSSGSSQPRNRIRVSCIAADSLPTELSGKPKTHIWNAAS